MDDNKVGTIAIVFSIIADCLAAIPTLVKSYHHPETEIAWPWLAHVIGIVLPLANSIPMDFCEYGFIIYIFIIDFMIYCGVRSK
jgi:hypothetical protein